MRICASEKVDLVILGARLPQSQKTVLLQQIKEKTTVPVLSLFHAGENLFTNIRADYYLDVDEEYQELVGMVRAILGRRSQERTAS